MVASASRARGDGNPFLGLVEAIADRQGELDIRLENVSLRLPFLPEPVEVSGSLTVSMHLRELTETEKDARAAKEVRWAKA